MGQTKSNPLAPVSTLRMRPKARKFSLHWISCPKVDQGANFEDVKWLEILYPVIKAVLDETAGDNSRARPLCWYSHSLRQGFNRRGR